MWQERGVVKTEMIATLNRNTALHQHQHWHVLPCCWRSRLCHVSFQTLFLNVPWLHIPQVGVDHEQLLLCMFNLLIHLTKYGCFTIVLLALSRLLTLSRLSRDISSQFSPSVSHWRCCPVFWSGFILRCSIPSEFYDQRWSVTNYKMYNYFKKL